LIQTKVISTFADTHTGKIKAFMVTKVFIFLPLSMIYIYVQLVFRTWLHITSATPRTPCNASTESYKFPFSLNISNSDTEGNTQLIECPGIPFIDQFIPTSSHLATQALAKVHLG